MPGPIGGSFAPPLPANKLATYKTLAGSCPDRQCKEKMLELIGMMELFQKTPASTLPGTPHPVGVGIKVPLEKEEIARIWDVVPWANECDGIGRLFDQLEGDVRNAAFHLLWFARELAADREPLTNDKL